MDEISRELFATLDQVVLERIDPASFCLIGTAPGWFSQVFPEAAASQSRLRLEQTFPFLENFLIDADRFWQTSAATILESGLWSERLQAQEYHLEALAIRLNNKNILLIKRADGAYQEKQTLLQVARENKLSYDRLHKEMQSKEILLHCIFHDLAGQVTTFSNCIELLSFEALSEQGKEYLNIGRRQIKRQTELLQEILQAFSAEIASQEVTTDPVQLPNLLNCAQSVIDTFAPSFQVQNKQLQLHGEASKTQNWQVIADRSRLERVLSNLVENAFRYTPEGSTVQINLYEEEEFLLCAVDDQGAGVPPESVKFLFQRFFQGEDHSGKAGLGLYFCRITVERWGGAIGYVPLATGGARFWFRLRKPSYC
jgi:hypothetical protein